MKKLLKSYLLFYIRKMENLLPVLLIIGLSMLAMNLGLIFKNKPLRKACGDSPDGCEICGGDQDKCNSNA
tara:strand:+ start:168 stop:377 length:210 start_codon:yes stop_codon:yes gene_type:complete